MFNKNRFAQILKNISETFENQRDFSKKSEINRTYLSQYMNMKIDKPPKPEILKRIADNSKGVTTYEELMEICGYQAENMETFVFNIYKEVKKFVEFIKSNDTDDAIDIRTIVNTFLKYLDNLIGNLLDENMSDEIFLCDIFYPGNVIDDFGYIIGFMILYDNLLKYLEKTNYIKIANYKFRDWFNKNEIYYIMNNYKKIVLFWYNHENFEILNKNDIVHLTDKIDEFSNYLTLCILNDFNGKNLLSMLFKNRVHENTNNNDSNLSVAEDSEPYYTNNNTIKIPVVGTVAAGEPILAEQNIIDYEELPAEEFKDGEYFGLKIKGDSMFPRILEGDVVIVRQQNDCDNGKVAVVLINGDEATVKQIKKTESGLMLIPYNKKYDPMFFTKEEIETKPVRIIGVVRRLIGYNFE